MRTTAIVNTLRSCKLFTGFPLPQVEQIAAISELKNLGKADYLFREGDPSQGFYIVQTGAINVHRVSAGGREQVIQVFRPGDSFAEGALIAEKGYPANARAVEPSQVLLIHRGGFIDLIKQQPELALRIIGALSQHLHVLVGLLDDLTLKNVEMRLANWLLKQCPNADSTKPVEIELPTTKRLLAAELGTVSETFSRTLAKFREQELLLVDGRRVTVVCPARLAEFMHISLAWGSPS